MLCKHLKEHIDGDNSQLPQNDWQLLFDWCLMVSQTNPDGNSLVHPLSMVKLMLSQDPKFVDWCTRRLDMSLGPAMVGVQGTLTPPGVTGQHGSEVEQIKGDKEAH